MAATGCGSAASHSTSTAGRKTTAQGPSTANAPPIVSDLQGAEHPRLDDFPTVAGRTFGQMSKLGRFDAQLGAATGTFSPGTSRFAFGLNAPAGQFIYAPTAVYVARSFSSPAQGPFLAPADSIGVAPQYRSKQNDDLADLRAIFDTRVPLPQAGTYYVLALTRTPTGLIGSQGEIAVAPSTRIPNVGQRAPDVATDTLASVHGNVSLLTTRLPPESMHSASFKDLLGKRPIALLFSTPELCVSKVCGPVTDVLVSLQREFAGRITFIHEEVYVKDQPTNGLRPQLKAFHLRTEPWLFTVNRRGVVAARLEGTFGVNEARAALEAALR